MDESKIQVLIKIDNRNLVTDINSDIFIADITDWIMIAEGSGDKHAHAQGNYLDQLLYDDQMRCNYIYEQNVVRTLTEAEKKLFYPPVTPELSEIEILQKDNHLLKAQVNALTEQGEFQDDLIAELATIVYA